MAGTKNFREDFTSQSRVIKISKIIILVQVNPPFPCLYCHQVIGQLVQLVYMSIVLIWKSVHCHHPTCYLCFHLNSAPVGSRNPLPWRHFLVV